MLYRKEGLSYKLITGNSIKALMFYLYIIYESSNGKLTTSTDCIYLGLIDICLVSISGNRGDSFPRRQSPL